MTSTWCVVVAYFPDKDRINRLIERLLSQDANVVVFDNGGARQSVEVIESVHIVGDGQNVGIATALNESVAFAALMGAEYIVTFDQDSDPPDGMIPTLRAHLNDNAAQDVVAVGPACYDVRDGAFTWPVFAPAGLGFKRVNPDNHTAPIQSVFLITSGMLFSLEGYRCVGPFDDSLFIDHVDTAWGLRANAKGMKLMTCPDVRMKHELSRSAPRFFLGRLVLDYPPIRRYYTARNSVRLALSDFTPLGLKIYFLATTLYRLFALPIFDPLPGKCFKAILTGIRDGVGQGSIPANRGFIGKS